MNRLIENVVNAVLGLRGGPAYVVVGALAFGEAAAFLGLVTPGEVAMVLGGVLSSYGRVDLASMATVAAVAAVAGDSAGYWLGRTFGTRILTWQRVQRRLRPHIERAVRYFRARGGRAVVFGRWVSVVRTFVPFAVGMTGMPYGRFLVFSVPAAASWAVTFVLLGYLAGASWHVVERYAGGASLVLLLLLAIAFVLRWLASRAIANQDRIRAYVDRLGERRPVRWIRGRFGRQLRWIAERFDPRVARGLGLTLGFVVLAVAGTLTGVILNDVRAFQGLARLDLPIRLWFETARTPALSGAAAAIERALGWPWVLVPTALAAVFAAWRATPRAAARTIVGVLGAAGIAVVVQDLVTERIAGTDFPPTAVMTASALVVHVVAVLGMRLEWAAAVSAAAVGSFLVAIAGLASLVTGAGALSGVAFGTALGVAWAAAVEVQARLPFRFLGEEPPPHRPLRLPEQSNR